VAAAVEQLVPEPVEALVVEGSAHQVPLHPLAETVLSILAGAGAVVYGQTLDHQVLVAPVW
jgi:uncharacterized RmlC-like cupin family protein